LELITIIAIGGRMFDFITKFFVIPMNNKTNKSSSPINPDPCLSELKCLAEVDIFCDKIIEPNYEIEAPLIIIAARTLLRSIVLYCVKEKICDFWKIADIVNSDTDLIINILSKYKDTQEGSKFISGKDQLSDNTIRVLRHFVNNYQC
jgi:hypothetical protein